MAVVVKPMSEFTSAAADREVLRNQALRAAAKVYFFKVLAVSLLGIVAALIFLGLNVLVLMHHNMVALLGEGIGFFGGAAALLWREGYRRTLVQATDGRTYEGDPEAAIVPAVLFTIVTVACIFIIVVVI